jgi:4-hydroxybenzoate polyprenyltransferase
MRFHLPRVGPAGTGLTPARLLRASHPEPAVAVTTVAALLSVGAGLGPLPAAGVTATIAASQLAVGWANDAIDAPRDARVGRADKPVALGTVSRRAAGTAAVVAALACLTLAVATAAGAGTPWAFTVAWLGLGSALAYDWPLKSTVLSPLPYAVSFACLPAFVVLVAGRPVPPWLVFAGALLGMGAHFANVVPDMGEDESTGVRGLPHRFGPVGALAASAVLLLAVTALLILGPPGPPRAFGAAAGALAVAVLLLGAFVGRRSAARHWAFRGVMAVALVDVVLLVAGGALD